MDAEATVTELNLLIVSYNEESGGISDDWWMRLIHVSQSAAKQAAQSADARCLTMTLPGPVFFTWENLK